MLLSCGLFRVKYRTEWHANQSRCLSFTGWPVTYTCTCAKDNEPITLYAFNSVDWIQSLGHPQLTPPPPLPCQVKPVIHYQSILLTKYLPIDVQYNRGSGDGGTRVPGGHICGATLDGPVGVQLWKGYWRPPLLAREGAVRAGGGMP